MGDDGNDIVAALHRDGVAVHALTVPDDVLQAADRFVVKLRLDASKRSIVHIGPRTMAADSAVFRWGLASEHLDLAECYLGVPARYLGLDVKRERSDGVVGGPRRWHRDVEDRRMVKVIVYLSDTGDSGGPFEYLDLAETERVLRQLDYRSGFVSEADVTRVVRAGARHAATGPRLSAIYADTARILHRVRPPMSQDRYSMTFTYTGMSPSQLFPEFMVPRGALGEWRDGLTPRQRSALFIS